MSQEKMDMGASPMPLESETGPLLDGLMSETGRTMDFRLLSTAEDVTPDVLADVERVFDGWYADESRIDWDDFIGRLVAGTDYDVEDMASPAVARIKRHVRKLRADA